VHCCMAGIDDLGRGTPAVKMEPAAEDGRPRLACLSAEPRSYVRLRARMGVARQHFEESAAEGVELGWLR